MFICFCRIQQWAMAKLFISTKQGAQTTLFCTLADGVNGLTYYHNCLGVVPSSELSYSQEKATKMWDLSIKLTQGYL